MKKYSVLPVLLTFIIGIVLSAEEVVTLKSGKKILVHDNNTWEEVKEGGEQKQAGETKKLYLKKTDDMTEVLVSSTSAYKVYFNPQKMVSVKSKNDAAEFQFNTVKKNAAGVTIFDGFKIKIESLRKILLTNAQKADPNAKLLEVRPCLVNGTEGELIKYKAGINGMDFIYLAFIASNDSGSIQFTFFTIEDQFLKVEPEIIAALSGLVLN